MASLYQRRRVEICRNKGEGVNKYVLLKSSVYVCSSFQLVYWLKGGKKIFEAISQFRYFKTGTGDRGNILKNVYISLVPL